MNGRKARERRRVATLMPELREDWPLEMKQGYAGRREANATGKCPHCESLYTVYHDGQLVARSMSELRAYVAAHPGAQMHGVMAHDDGCPALLGAD